MSKRRLRLLYLLGAMPVIVVVFAWARSYLPHESFVFSNDGRLVFVFADGQRSSSFKENAQRYLDLDGQLAAARLTSRFTGSFLGLELVSGPVAQSGARRFGSAYRLGEYRILSISYAWVLFLAACLSAIAIHLLRRSALRSRANLCKNCGYDLRASTDRCPECGTTIPLPASAA